MDVACCSCSQLCNDGFQCSSTSSSAVSVALATNAVRQCSTTGAVRQSTTDSIMQYVAPSQQQQPSQLTGLGKIRKFADSNGNLTMYFTWNTFLICFQFQFQNLHIEKRLNFREPPTNCRTMQWIIQNCSAQTPRKSKKP